MKGRSPNKKEKEHMDQVSQLGCIVCHNMGMGYVPCEIHHVIGKTKPNAHLSVLPLCFEHHRRGDKNELYVSRHPYKREFEKRYGKEKDLLKQVANMIYI